MGEVVDPHRPRVGGRRQPRRGVLRPWAIAAAGSPPRLREVAASTGRGGQLCHGPVHGPPRRRWRRGARRAQLVFSEIIERPASTSGDGVQRRASPQSRGCRPTCRTASGGSQLSRDLEGRHDTCFARRLAQSEGKLRFLHHVPRPKDRLVRVPPPRDPTMPRSPRAPCEVATQQIPGGAPRCSTISRQVRLLEQVENRHLAPTRAALSSRTRWTIASVCLRSRRSAGSASERRRFFLERRRAGRTLGAVRRTQRQIRRRGQR